MESFGNKHFRIYNDNCLNILPNLDDNSIDLVITDPPYFISKLDGEWNAKKIKEDKKQTLILNIFQKV